MFIVQYPKLKPAVEMHFTLLSVYIETKFQSLCI